MSNAWQAAQSTSELRQILAADLRNRKAVWLRAPGLSAERVSDHAALLRTLYSAGVTGPSPADDRANTVVVDWSTVDTSPADGFAMFAVLGHHLQRSGREVIVCGPTLSDLTGFMIGSRMREAECWAHWIDVPQSRAIRIQPLGRAAIFGGSLGRGNLETFFSDLFDGLAGFGADNSVIELVEGVAVDLVQNALAHASDSVGCIAALIEHRRRPPRVQLGLADAGPGMPAHLLRLPMHDGLSPFTDYTVVEAILNHALSGRSGGSGGGFTRLARRITRELGGEVCVRSGAGLVQLRGMERDRGGRLTTGWGTQVLLRVPVRG